MAYIQNQSNYTTTPKAKGFDPSSIAFKPIGGSGGQRGPLTQPANQSTWNWNPADFNGGAAPPSWMLGFLSQYMPLLRGQADFASALEPQRQSEISRFITTLSPQNMQKNADSVYRKTYAQSRRKARLGGMTPGMSQSLKDAMLLQAHNTAAETAGDYTSRMHSPEGQSAISQAILSAIAGGQQMPFFNNALALQGMHNSAMGLEFGKPKEQNGFGGLLGGLAAGAVQNLPWGKWF